MILNLLGIRDPLKTKSGQDLEQTVVKHFQNTVSVNHDSSYSVHFSWIKDHLVLLINYELTLRRLNSTINRFLKDDCCSAYEKVFDKWLEKE